MLAEKLFLLRRDNGRSMLACRLSVVITTAGRQCTANLHPRLSTVVDAVVVVVLCQGGPALAKLELIRKTRFPALALASVKFRTVFTIQ